MRRLLATLLPLALVVAACGDDDDATPTSTTARPFVRVTFTFTHDAWACLAALVSASATR